VAVWNDLPAKRGAVTPERGAALTLSRTENVGSAQTVLRAADVFSG
jgi:hypothetical protein